MTSSRTQFDVLVVGLGPAGSSAAGQAAALGGSVLAVDSRKQVGQPVQCAEFIPLPIQSYASADGVQSQSIRKMRTELPSGAYALSDFRGRMIHRQVFDQELVCQAHAAGAMISLATRLTRLNVSDACAVIRCRGKERHVHFRYLIAADGPHSTVAKFMGLSCLPTVTTRQYTVPLLTPMQHTRVWLGGEFPGGYAWLFPKSDVAHLGLGVDRKAGKELKQTLDGLHRGLIAQNVVGATLLGQTGGAIPVGGMREQLVYKNMVFVGDAAGLTHPITGAGIAAAVISGEHAGVAVARHLQGQADALSEYDTDMRDQFYVSLQRAVKRRTALLAKYRSAKQIDETDFRQAWVAFDEYYAA
jgi:geranylgeranyl reductase family protein